ncbi:Hypothetical protein GL50581_3140 [Giardia duodenalis ATCC 50581]|uniref:Uncharacterized protein n=1 Tax=Giardia intestinalis (strain ATCC 50581 / GS clone H7) TaxID=598745 RepID=C6LWI1_GIAIB|nr:Hypothetical protein GL50581_3140 [Giardia intestinalis ATCC 50581]
MSYCDNDLLVSTCLQGVLNNKLCSTIYICRCLIQ